MRATLSFELPEDQENFDLAVKGADAHLALWEISESIFRPARKHGYPDQNIQNLLTNLDDLIEKLKTTNQLPSNWPTDEYGPLNASDLIGKLENQFRELLRYRAINL